MIFATDDQNFVIELVAGVVLCLLQADVVIWIGSIPVQAVWNRTAWDPGANDVGAVGGLLAVDYQPVIDWRIGADYDIVRTDDVTVARRDACGLAILDFLR